ncbi:hypothetical protein HHI36_016899, partial [Cryptolaemus montrouzieri]
MRNLLKTSTSCHSVSQRSTAFTCVRKKSIDQIGVLDFNLRLGGLNNEAKQLSKKAWFHVPWDRGILKTINRIRSNQGAYPKHLYKLGIIDSSNCSCDEGGDLNHIMFDCNNN